MKFYYNPITLNLLERQYQGQEPYWTEIVPPFNLNYNQFAKFETDKWVVKDKKQEGFYVSYKDLSVIRVNQFDDVDISNYSYGIIQNEGDEIEWINANKIKYTVVSDKTLNFYKEKKLAEIELILDKNNEKKAILKMKLDKLVDIQEILDLQIKFLDIQTININDIADNFIADIRNRQEDRDYLASLNKKFFIEFNEAS